MSRISQKEATYQSVLEAFNVNNINFTPNVTYAKLHLNKALRKQVVSILMDKFNSTLVEVSEDFMSKTITLVQLSKYCNGLLSNWLRKDTRLNGGAKYTANINTSAKTENSADKKNKVKKGKSAFVKSIDENLVPNDLKHLLS
jgi:hypothetical protein